jgi:hypothetical protein
VRTGGGYEELLSVLAKLPAGGAATAEDADAPAAAKPEAEAAAARYQTARW